MEPLAAKQLRLSKQQRLRTSSEFKRCYDSVRAGDGHLLVFAVPNGLGYSRIGVSVSKKHGNAPARNRRKRLLRESFRLQQHDLAQGLDLVLVPRQISHPDLGNFKRSLKQLSRKLERRLTAKKNQEQG